MRPLYVFLLAGPHSPTALGFCSPPSSPSLFISQPLAPKSHHLTSCTGHTAPSRRTSGHRPRSTATAASSCGRDRHDATRRQGLPLGSLETAKIYRPSRWTGCSASTRGAVQHLPVSSSSAVASSRVRIGTRSSRSSRERGGARASASVMPVEATVDSSSLVASRGAGVDEDAADPTAAAHAYLSEFLGMTAEELQQLSDKYRSLPATRRGPDEITVASPELAPAATRTAEAAAAAATAAAAAATTATATASGDVAIVSADGSATGGAGDAGDERGREEEREVTVRAAADQAATAVAGRLLVPEIPALASMLHQQMGVPKERVKRLLLKWPRLLEVSGYHLRECVGWLTGTLGLRPEEVAKLVLAYPPLLIKSVDYQLKPNLYWLENDVGLTRTESRRAVNSCPQLLAKSVTSNFMPKIKFFQDVLRLDMGGVSGLLVRYPQLFNFSLENMAWKARWLEEELLLDPYQVRRVLTRCPSVFAYSAERNLVPTLEFFVDELGATKAQVREAVIKKPRLLGMSLENRLVPRLQAIRGAGFTPSWDLHHEVMLFASDIVFRRWLREEPTGAARRRREIQGGLSQTGRRHH